MKLVIQVKTKDNLKELKGWVEDSFGIIENKNYGFQDFSKYNKNGIIESDEVQKLPYAGEENEMITMETIADRNQMTLVFSLQADYERFEKKSLNLLYSLINHKGGGSLYQCLKSLNLITSIQIELNTEVMTAFRFITVGFKLTE